MLLPPQLKDGHEEELRKLRASHTATLDAVSHMSVELAEAAKKTIASVSSPDRKYHVQPTPERAASRLGPGNQTYTRILIVCVCVCLCIFCRHSLISANRSVSLVCAGGSPAGRASPLPTYVTFHPTPSPGGYSGVSSIRGSVKLPPPDASFDQSQVGEVCDLLNQ